MPKMEIFHLNSLNVLEYQALVLIIMEEKVKKIVWDYDNFKSQGPDGFNFGFLKDFWDEYKIDFM